MGLDTTHDCWHGAYSGFTRWRQELAKIAGYAVWWVADDPPSEANNFRAGLGRHTVMLDWGHVTHENLMGVWAKTPDDPLVVLLAHCDDTGDIYPEQAFALAARLQELRGKIPQDHPDGEWLRAKTDAFVKGLMLAWSKSERVHFA
jgi:hypothetical protein